MSSIQRLVSRARRLLFGPSFYELLDRVRRLEGDMSQQRELLEQFSRNPEAAWLYANRVERMDAQQELFDDRRRRFHIRRYEFACAYVQGQQVADIACGTGYGAALLATGGEAAGVVGIDISEEAIDYANRHYFNGQTQFLCCPATDTYLPEGSQDVVVSFETIEHLEDEQGLLTEFHRLLRPDGVLICSTPNQWPLETSPFHVREYDLISFREALSGRFHIEAMYNQNSGSGQFNRRQPEGIKPTTLDNAALAECFIAVCRRRMDVGDEVR